MSLLKFQGFSIFWYQGCLRIFCYLRYQSFMNWKYIRNSKLQLVTVSRCINGNENHPSTTTGNDEWLGMCDSPLLSWGNANWFERVTLDSESIPPALLVLIWSTASAKLGDFIVTCEKTRHNDIFCISRNNNFKRLRCCNYLMPQCMNTRFTV